MSSSNVCLGARDGSTPLLSVMICFIGLSCGSTSDGAASHWLNLKNCWGRDLEEGFSVEYAERRRV